MTESQYVIFKLQNEEYGLDILQVSEIVLLQEIKKFPMARVDYFEGLINLRGNIIPIIDLRRRFYGESVVVCESSRIIVATSQNQLIGIMVDEIIGVELLNEQMIEPPPPIFGQNDSGVRGVAKLENRLIILLDLNQTFCPEDSDRIREAVC